MRCAACVNDATTKVHGQEVCDPHALGMMTAVLSGDFTPVGYIIAAACDEVPQPTVRVSAGNSLAAVSPFMRHGALVPLPLPRGASHLSHKPGPLTSHWPGR